MDLTLNGFSKNVVSYSTRAQISKVIKRIPRKSHARNAARISNQRICLGALEIASVVVIKKSQKSERQGQKGIWQRIEIRRQTPSIAFQTNPNR
jgi:hypothetical protein